MRAARRTGPRRHVVVMAKLPRAGRVKTRLARSIGGAEALRVYRTLLFRTLRHISADPRWRTWIALTPDRARLSWPGCLSIEQGSGDLGARMQRLLDSLPRGPVVIVGGDIPGMHAGDLASAFRMLGNHDVVFGPALDGGYWLVGARRRPRVPKLFANVRWSSAHALADTLINTRGLKVAQLRTLRDVDEPGDYTAWRRGGL